MNGKHYIGDKAATFKSTGRTRGIDGVALVVDDGTEYKAGDQLGYVLVLECPYGTQAMADALLEKLRGQSYEGFETTGAALPSGAELGDGVTVKGLYAPIVRRRVQFVGDLAADVSAPTGGDTDHEFGFTDPVQRQIERAAARSRSYIEKKADEVRIGVEDEVDGKLSEITVDLEGVKSTVRGQGGDISTLQQTAKSLASTVEDQGGSISTLQQTAKSLASTVEDQGGSISTLQQTATSLNAEINGENGVKGQLSLKVDKTDNNQVVSMLNIATDELNIKNNRFVLDSTNFKVAADGTVEMRNAKIESVGREESITIDGGSMAMNGSGWKGYFNRFGVYFTSEDLPDLVGVMYGVDSCYFNPPPGSGGGGTQIDAYGIITPSVNADMISEGGTALGNKYLWKNTVAHGHAIVNHGGGANVQGTAWVSFGKTLPSVPTVVAVPYATDSTFVKDFCMGTISTTGFNITYTRVSDSDTHFMWIAMCD